MCVRYLQHIILYNSCLCEQREKKQLEESLAEIKEQEEEMSRANRALTIRLEDVQVRAAKPSVGMVLLRQRSTCFNAASSHRGT